MRLLPGETFRAVRNAARRAFAAPKTPHPVTHVIFDMDGVLLDTEKIHERSAANVAAKFGKTYGPDLRYRVLGAPELDGARMVVDELRLPVSIEQYVRMVRAFEDEALSDVDLLPGVDRLVRHLHKNKVPIAVATSSSKKSFDVKTFKHQSLFSHFDHVVTGASDPEVKRGKPSPDIFLACASRFADRPRPNECLVFEDSPNGVRGAVDAGMQVVMLPDPLLPEDLRSGATVVLDGMDDFVPELFSLPPYSH